MIKWWLMVVLITSHGDVKLERFQFDTAEACVTAEQWIERDRGIGHATCVRDEGREP